MFYGVGNGDTCQPAAVLESFLANSSDIICFVIVIYCFWNYYITRIIIMSGIVIIIIVLFPCTWVIISTVSDVNFVLTYYIKAKI